MNGRPILGVTCHVTEDAAKDAVVGGRGVLVTVCRPRATGGLPGARRGDFEDSEIRNEVVPRSHVNYLWEMGRFPEHCVARGKALLSRCFEWPAHDSGRGAARSG